MYIAMWEVGAAINSISDWITKSPVLNTVISNPFTVSLLFTAIAVVIIMAVFHIKPSAAALARSSIYIYALTLLVMCLHQKSVTRTAFDESRSSEVQAVVGGVVASQRSGQSVDYVDVRSTLGRPAGGLEMNATTATAQHNPHTTSAAAPRNADALNDIRDATVGLSPRA